MAGELREAGFLPPKRKKSPLDILLLFILA
jgi:hypothetical protein